LICVDVMVAGVHFKPEWCSGADVGWRVAMANLADIAAMGGHGTALVVAVTAPPDTDPAWFEELAVGLSEACGPLDVGVVGGDLSSGPVLSVAATALGEVTGAGAVTRGGAKSGDVVALAGATGYSAAGLACLSAELPGHSADRVATPGSSCASASHQTSSCASASESQTEESRVQRQLAGLAEANEGLDEGRSPEEQNPAIQPGPTDMDAATPLRGAQHDKGSGHPADRAAISQNDDGASLRHDDGANPRHDGEVSPQTAAMQQAVQAYRRPAPPLAAGPAAAQAGATAMIDVSDGLLLDAGRIAAASGVDLVLDPAAPALAGPADSLADLAKRLGVNPLDWVLTGGEDHALLATFPGGAVLPAGWSGIGHCMAGPGRVRLLGNHQPASAGWDHFA